MFVLSPSVHSLKMQHHFLFLFYNYSLLPTEVSAYSVTELNLPGMFLLQPQKCVEQFCKYINISQHELLFFFPVSV